MPKKRRVTLTLTEHEIRVLNDALTRYIQWGSGDAGNTREDYRDMQRGERVQRQLWAVADA